MSNKVKNQAADAPKPEDAPKAEEASNETEQARPDPRADDEQKTQEPSAFEPSAFEPSAFEPSAFEPSAFEPTREEFIEYLRGEEVQGLAAKFDLVVTVAEANAPEADKSKWPSWRYKDGSASQGKMFNNPEEVPTGWTAEITQP